MFLFQNSDSDTIGDTLDIVKAQKGLCLSNPIQAHFGLFFSKKEFEER